MSQVKLEMIWQHDKVLPYILNNLLNNINAISTVHRVILYGSRAKTDIENWDILQGKDWDIIVIANSPIINTDIWTQAKGYHIDLRVINKEQGDKMLAYLEHFKELYPKNQLIKENSTTTITKIKAQLKQGLSKFKRIIQRRL